ncbi:hypothetical protein HGRIS_004187 [Hohenbuehelia grisea]|uniref:Uncharacterized protein n=1 Tax=Hohenbuehelia grisea TaxID=104357 RepID=A0ABR3JIZ1_9AGAR
MADSQGQACSDCGATFPQREDSTGPCAKCLKLSNLARESAEYADILNWPQCEMCGVTYRNMRPPAVGQVQTCNGAGCKQATGSVAAGDHDNDELGAQQPLARSVLRGSSAANTTNTPETYQLRAAATRDRLKLSAQHHNAGPGTTHTTEALLSYEHGGGAPGEQKFFIAWQVRNSKTPSRLDPDMGCHSKRWASSVALPDVKADVVATLNVHWAKNKAPLSPDHVSFRWFGNRLFDRNTSTLSVGAFYEHYNVPSKAPCCLNDIPNAFKHLRKQKLPVLCFEVYIDYQGWTADTDPDENDDNDGDDDDTADGVMRSALKSLAARNGKRTRALSSAAAPLERTVRLRSSAAAVPESHFSLSSRAEASRVHRQSPVSLSKIICVADKTTGACKLIDSDTTVIGKIIDTPFARGTMKQAYELITQDGDQLVAKRFVKLSEDDDTANV